MAGQVVSHAITTPCSCGRGFARQHSTRIDPTFVSPGGLSIPSRVLVIGSLNVDLWQKMPISSITIDGMAVDLSSVKGMTLPAPSFVRHKGIANQLASGKMSVPAGEEEAFLMKVDGPFKQKTGGKGAGAAAAAGQTLGRAELICNFGLASAPQNEALLADLERFGNVQTQRSCYVTGPTGTAYVNVFPDNDNAIVLLGGANMQWPTVPFAHEGSDIRNAIKESAVVMLQREVPEYVNLEVARAASELQVPVFMDVGGTDAPLDASLMPFISVIAPNETELTFISGVETVANGKVQETLIREAVATLKSKFVACGNANVEVLVTLGSSGSMHFSAGWTNSGTLDENRLLPLETRMGCFALGTDNGMPRDTTGAGDCFRGSYVAARYGEEKAVVAAMQWAAAAASLAVEVDGAIPSMPLRRDIEARIRMGLKQAMHAQKSHLPRD